MAGGEKQPRTQPRRGGKFASTRGRPASVRADGATVAGLAGRFGLEADHLEAWGVHDLPGGGEVGIRYRGLDGSELFVRRRTALTATGHTYQPTGAPLAAYGLWRLHLAHEHGWLLLVEGESDCWTLWEHELPCLGMPGADAVACIPAAVWGPAIKTVYIWQEPDEAGARFAEKARQTLRARGHLRAIAIVRPPPGIKDVADLRCAAPGTFADTLTTLLRESGYYPEPGEAPSLPGGSGEGAPPPEPDVVVEAAPAPPKRVRRPRAGRPKKDRAGREGASRPPDELQSPSDNGQMRPLPAPPAPAPAPKAPPAPAPAPAPADPPDYAQGNSVKPLFRSAAELERKAIRWFVEPWIPFAKLTAISGRFGSGKSTFGAHLLGRAHRSVVLPGGEEEAGDELCDRLERAGVELQGVAVADTRQWMFPSDRDRLAGLVRDWNADLVWIDPIDGYLAEGSENDGEYVRPALESLAWVARKTGAAVVFVRHPGKDPGNIMPGSRQWSNVPRVILELLEDEAHEDTRIIRPYKKSRGNLAPATYYHLDGEGDEARLWRWGEVCGVSVVDDIKREPDVESRRDIDRAMSLLRLVLAPDPVDSKVAIRMGLDEGLQPRTLQRALRRLDGKYHRVGVGVRHRAYWYVPGLTTTPLPTDDR